MMKGLLIKDYYCLKKSLRSFLLLTIGVIIIGVMFALSMQHGNMAVEAAEMAEKSRLNDATVFDMFRIAVWLVIVIPMAFVGNVVDCFKEDMRADFGKLLFSLPVSSKEIVGARYLVCMLYGLVSFVGATITALFISGASGEYPFSELMSVAVIFGSVMLAYLSIVMCFIYQLGVKYADYIQAAPILLAIVGIGIFASKKMSAMEKEALNPMVDNMWDNVKAFVLGNAWIFLMITVVFLVITYFASVKIVEKRRGKAIC